MADGLPDGDRSWQSGKSVPDIGKDVCLLTLRRGEVDVNLAEMESLGMLVEFRAAGAAPDRFHLGYFCEQLFGQQAKPMRLGKRDARIILKRENKRAFVEGR